MIGISTVRNNVGVVIINALGRVLFSREYHDALKAAIARGLTAQEVDLTREALTAMVREGEAAGMYADDHGAAGFCTDHATPAPDERVEYRCRRDPACTDRWWPPSHSQRCAEENRAAGFCTDHGQAAPVGATVTREAVVLAEAARDLALASPNLTPDAALDLLQKADLGLTVTDTPTGAHLRPLPRERYDAVLDSGPAAGRLCGWCGGPQHEAGDCVVAHQVEVQRLCDEDEGADCG